MASIIATVYEDLSGAWAAETAARRHGPRWGVSPDAVATVSRDRAGVTRVSTNHLPDGTAPGWTGLWEPLLRLVFLSPALGAPAGSGTPATLARVARLRLDPGFRTLLRRHLVPGASALLVLVTQVRPETVVSDLEELGGTAYTTAVDAQALRDLHASLQGRVGAGYVPAQAVGPGAGTRRG